MKHKHSVSHAYKKRNTVEIPNLYRRAKQLAVYPTTTQELFRIAAELPVDQFYIPDDAALRYVRSRWIHGANKEFLSPYKKRNFEALYDTVCKMMQEEKYRALGLATTTIIALSRPAPCVGLTPFLIHKIYVRHNKKNNKE